MIFNVFCKASSQIGLGHLIRSYSFVNQILEFDKNLEINFYLIGDISLAKLIVNSKINLIKIKDEIDLCENIFNSDVSIIDMLEISEEVLLCIKSKTKSTTLLSPIFNHLNLIDNYFGRTKYLNFKKEDYPDLKVFAGLEYAIIQKNCTPINSGVYE